MTKTITQQAARVESLRAELSAAERELSQTVAEAKAAGMSTTDIPTAAYRCIKWPLVEAAAKRLKAAA